MLLIKKAYALRAFKEIQAVGEKQELIDYLAEVCERDESYIQLIKEGSVSIEPLTSSITMIVMEGIAETIGRLKRPA